MNRELNLAEEQDAAWFPSRVDGWLLALLVLMPLISVGALVWALLGNGGEIWGAVFASILFPILYVVLVLPMAYGVSDDFLIVRHGMVRQRVRLRDIEAVMPTRNPLSSPALSLDRLRVKYGQGFSKSILISPDRRDEFLDLLVRRTGLRRDGDRLMRATGPQTSG